MSKPHRLPLPPEQVSPKGPKGSGPHGSDHDTKAVIPDEKPRGPTQADNPDQLGQSANTKQNTTHQGYQQDR